MFDDDATRNFGATPGYDLHDSIDLPGWDDANIWGYDRGIGSFLWAQLWRNPATSRSPISGWPGSTRPTRSRPASPWPSPKPPAAT
jgi:hypothetical protein